MAGSKRVKRPVNPEQQKPNGQFKPGNTAAVRNGKRSHRQMLIDVAGEEAIQRIWDKIVKQAEEGCTQSQGLVAERTVPKIKAAGVKAQFDIDLGSPSQAAVSILQAVAEGTLSSDQGKDLIQSLTAAAEMARLEVLATEVAELKALISNALAHKR